MKGLREADLKKAAALAELKPPLDATDRQTLPLKILPAGELVSTVRGVPRGM